MKKIIIYQLLFLLFPLLLTARTKTILNQEANTPIILTDCTTLDQDVHLQNQCELVVPDLLATIEATTSVGTPTLTQSPAAGTVISTQQGITQLVTITATDNLGLTATCTVTLTAKDVTPPTFVEICSVADQDVRLTNNCALIVPDLTTALTTTDNCDDRLTVTQQPVAGSILTSNPDSTHTVTLTAIDNAGFSTHCTVKLTAKDVIAPIMLTDCAAIRPIAALNADCQITIPDLTDSIRISENCDLSVIITQTPAANTVLAAATDDTPIVTIVATDAAGNSSTCAITLEVQDVTPPTLLFDCDSLHREVVLDDNCMISIPNFIDTLAATDNCSAVTFNQSPAADSLTTLDADATKEVVITATDANGNVTTCTVELTAIDISAPVITTDCSELDWRMNLTSGCKIVVPNFIGAIETTGGCSEVTVTQFPLPGSSIPSAHEMIHEIEMTATDEAGLSSTCIILLTGRDKTEPEILTDCSRLDRDVILDENCTLVIPNLTSTLAVADNCSEVFVTQSPSANTSVNAAEEEVIEVVITVTDAAGYTTDCTARLTAKNSTEQLFGEQCGLTELAVDLNENCMVVIPDVTSQLPTVASCGLTVSYTQIPAADSIETSFHDNTHRVTINALFSDNSTTSCMVTLVAKDNSAPVFADCAALAQEVNLGSDCQLTIPDLTTAAVTDNCSEVTITQSPIAGTIMDSDNREIHPVQLIATDAYGNVSTCEVLLTARDKTIPVITTDCSDLNQTIALTEDCELVVPDLTGMISATDNCSNHLNILQSPTAGTRLRSAHDQKHRIMILVMDEAENPRTCAVFLTGQDISAPIVAEDCSQLAQEVALDENCTVVIPDLTDLVAVADNCGGEVAITQIPAAGQIIESNHNDLIGVAFILRDVLGNETTCATTLTAVDRTAPLPLPRQLFTTLNASGVAVITAAQLDAGSTDNCGIAAMTVEPNIFTQLGEYEVLFTVIDAAGNQQFTSTFITVGESPEDNALSLAVVDFTAKEQAGKTHLQWSITDADAVTAYRVEWSTDAQTWTTIGAVATKSQQSNYQFTHTKPARGWNYYRLQQIEADGSAEFSPTIDVQITSLAATETLFYPNPTNGVLNIDLSTNFVLEQPILVNLYDHTGTLVQQQYLTNQQMIDVSNLATGLYQIELKQNDMRSTARVLIID